jgi:hypothetical protein
MLSHSECLQASALPKHYLLTFVLHADKWSVSLRGHTREESSVLAGFLLRTSYVWVTCDGKENHPVLTAVQVLNYFTMLGPTTCINLL